jgi:hypothetical protein
MFRSNINQKKPLHILLQNQPSLLNSFPNSVKDSRKEYS